MLKNYFEIDENLKLNGFLKEVKDKKNSHYIILNTKPESFVDIKSMALHVSNLNEKLKNLKKRLVICDDDTQDRLNLLMESGDRVIKTWDGYFDFLDALEEILEIDYNFLDYKISDIEQKEVYALNEDDKISSARNLFLKKKINILPVIDKVDVIGELRPIDFLVTNLFKSEEKSTNFFNEKHKDNILNMPITNLINKRPITIDKNRRIKDAINIMIKKSLPSIIVIDEDNKLYSIISYKDILKLYKKETEKPRYLIEYANSFDLYDDEFALIKKFSEKAMKKITNMSTYDSLKLSFKIIGDKDAGHQKKLLIKVLLAHGTKKVLHVEKEIKEGTSDEVRNDKVKKKWNIPLIVQDALDILEKKVKDEKRKNKR